MYQYKFFHGQTDDFVKISDHSFKFFKGYCSSINMLGVGGQFYATASIFNPNGMQPREYRTNIHGFDVGPVERIGEGQFRININRTSVNRVPTKGERFVQFLDNRYMWLTVMGFSITTIIYSVYQLISSLSVILKK